MVRKMSFGNDDGEKTVICTINLGTDGKQLGQKEYSYQTWKELQAHASFPEKQTEIKTENFTAPVGTFDCWHYIIKSETDGKKNEKHLWFAKSLPGPPICYEESTDGKILFRMIMLKSEK